MPKVSVILPTYNRENLLGRAIQSVLDQTYHDFELIIVDDGSTDNTEKLVKSFEIDKIVYIRHRENRGVATARNTGLGLAKGYYIAFHDSDDEWLPDKLEKQIGTFETAPSDVGIVYCGHISVIGDHKWCIRCFEYRTNDCNVFSNIVQRCFVLTSTLMVKRECFERAGGFDERFPLLEDWELFLRLSKLYSFIGVDEPLAIRYLQPDSLSGNNSKFITAFNLLLQKYYDDIKLNDKLLSKCYFKLGHCLIVEDNLKQGRYYLSKSVKASPFDPRSTFAFMLSLFGKSVYKTFTQIYRLIRFHITGYPY